MTRSEQTTLPLRLEAGAWVWILMVAVVLFGLWMGRLSSQVEATERQLARQERELRLLQAYTMASAASLLDAGMVDAEDVALLVDAKGAETTDEEE